MKLTDSHAHLYLEAFDDDRSETLERALAAGVERILLPNIDKDSILPMMALSAAFPEHCFPMIGLHPTSVGPDYRVHLDAVDEWLNKERFFAIGEMGIDLYWDRTYLQEQQEAFRHQVRLALAHDLPVVIHSRDSFDEIFGLLDELKPDGLRGVFHCFTGNAEQAARITGMGLMLGIGGVLTYKNSGLPKALEAISLECMLLETDAPFLAPVPHRGKRNESAYLPEIARKLAEVRGVSVEEVAAVTTENAKRLFNI